METLFDTSKYFQKERPTKPTEKQIEEFYNKKVDEIIKFGHSSSDKEDIKSDLIKLSPFRSSGFELAKELECYSMSAEYDIDADFISWLEDLDYDFRKLSEINIKEWVKCHDIKPKFSLGQKLLIKARLCYGKNTGDIVYINGFRESTAEYLIDQDSNRKGGTILTYELVENNCEVL